MNVFAFEQFDELESFRKAETLPPPPQDCDQTAVYADLWSADGTTMLRFAFVVSHVGEHVRHVAFEEGWRLMLRALGEDPYDSDVEAWLVNEAKRAFRKRG